MAMWMIYRGQRKNIFAGYYFENNIEKRGRKVQKPRLLNVITYIRLNNSSYSYII
jgi:hypothetical protein